MDFSYAHALSHRMNFFTYLIEISFRYRLSFSVIDEMVHHSIGWMLGLGLGRYE